MLPLLIFSLLLCCTHFSQADNVAVAKNATLGGAVASINELGYQAVEKGVLTYRLPLLNQTLPALPCRLANSTVGELAKDLVNKASAKEAAIQDVIKSTSPSVANQTSSISILRPLGEAGSLCLAAHDKLYKLSRSKSAHRDISRSSTGDDLQYTGWVPVVLADGQTYLAAARNATAAPLYYSLMLPPGSPSTSFQLRSVMIVRSRDVLLTGYAADGRPPYTYVASGACDLTQDCTIGDFTAMYGWGELSAVTFTAAPPTCSSGTYGQFCSLPDDCHSNGATNPSDGTCICFAPYTVPLFNITLHNVYITSTQFLTASGSEETFAISLNYGSIEATYFEYDATTGALSSETQTGYDFVRNVAI